MSDLLRLYLLLCGFEILEKSASTRDRDERIVLAVPVSAYLLETRQGWVLVDCGLNSALINDPALREQYYTGRGWRPPLVLPQHELQVQLDAIGVRPEQVNTVVLTHMHMDHTGNLKLFPNARVVAQRAEHSYAFAPDHDPAWFDCDYQLPGLRWQLLDGDAEVMPGLRCLSTPGHTPGHQSLLLELPRSGPVILVGDVGDLQENFDDEILGESMDDAAALASIRRLKRLAQEHSAQLFLTHDPDFVRRARLAPNCYD